MRKVAIRGPLIFVIKPDAFSETSLQSSRKDTFLINGIQHTFALGYVCLKVIKSIDTRS